MNETHDWIRDLGGDGMVAAAMLGGTKMIVGIASSFAKEVVAELKATREGLIRGQEQRDRILQVVDETLKLLRDIDRRIQ